MHPSLVKTVRVTSAVLLTCMPSLAQNLGPHMAFSGDTPPRIILINDENHAIEAFHF